ncbi:MAG TPA: hypothetical protein P5077_05150 [bacterium]|nr:hypothetical protein [bacterium]
MTRSLVVLTLLSLFIITCEGKKTETSNDAGTTPPAAVVDTGPATGETLAAAETTVNPANSNELEAVSAKGKLLYTVDWFGSEGTDFLLGKDVLQNDRRLKGWVVMLDPDKKARVIFYGPQGTGYAGYHQASFSKDAAPTYQDISSQPLGPKELAFIKARELVTAQFTPPCNVKYNTAVVPATDDTIAVYMLPSTRDPGEVPIGGAEVFYADPKGEKILKHEAFFKSCLTMRKSNTDGSGQVVSLAMNHITSNIPNEIHVFVSLLYRLPLHVITPDMVTWNVENGNIVKDDLTGNNRGEKHVRAMQEDQAKMAAGAPKMAVTIWSYESGKNGQRVNVKLMNVMDPLTKKNIEFKPPDAYMTEAKKRMAEHKDEEGKMTPGKTYYTYLFIDLNNPTAVIDDIKTYTGGKQ